MSIVFVSIVVSGAAWMCAYGLVAAIRLWAERRQMLDIPNERSSHTRPTPRGGGLAIVVVTLAGSWLVYPWFGAGISIKALLAYTLGGALISAVSWLDDLRPLSRVVRFASHSLGALLAILAIGYWQTLPVPGLGTLTLGWLGLLISFFWIVGLTNAYNFMDGIDGLAGGQAVVAGIGWAALGGLSGQTCVSLIGLLLAASGLGFLWHNWPPAHIFMGDVGSAFLGYTFAVLTLIASQTQARFILVGAALVWPFIFDTVFTFLRRLIRREKVFSAHRSHLYQRLIVAGLSHRTVTLLYLALAGLGGILALAVVQVWPFADMIILIVLVCVGIILWGGVRWYEHHPLSVSSRPLSKL